jgi:hypothetical protein
VNTGFWYGNLKERDDTENLGVDGTIILTDILKKSVESIWSGLIWLSIGAGGRLI